MAYAGDDVKPYKLKVLSKYLQLTRQKLELTRLPHEGSTVISEDWWEPKPQVEPIIEYWLEKYSDPLPNTKALIFTVADMLNTLMRRLSYEHYLVSNTGAGHASPAKIDWKLVDQLAIQHPDSCLGTHLISPPLASPHVAEAPWEWTNNSQPPSSISSTPAKKRSKSLGGFPKDAVTPARLDPARLGLNAFDLREPNTLAYALCDSPTGLLVFALKGLRTHGPRTNFTHDQIITLTNLAWLPGPEYAMRFWAHCAAHEDGHGAGKSEGPDKAHAKPRVAITVFLGGEQEPAESGLLTGDASKLPTLPQPTTAERYVPPAWGRARYDVVHAQRVAGKPGLLAWERPKVIAAGVRGLAKKVLAVDGRLKASTIVAAATEPDSTPAPLERVVVRVENSERANPSIRLPTVHEGQAFADDGLLKRPEPAAFLASSSRTVVSSAPSGNDGKDQGKIRTRTKR
ncbi:hypothetical protein P8C59_001278 [Phyllachora maydis]|uniref:Uncharacterized protein n=1 Tax=Phyllachora maydis TaxID=1825666 RepID=A0AAD9HY20_9PEZI|nr:hypothetical protein P8C59_001278 [Phyllachora maydis]